jgi:Icc-related predicted phosphoesterase
MANRFWIVFGDIHERVEAVERIDDVRLAEGVFLSGDLTNIGTREGAGRIVSTVAAMNPRVLAQIGNMDTPVVERVLTEQGINVHAQVRDLGGGVCLAAVGYSTPTPFNTPSEVDEAQICQWTHDVLEGAGTFEQVILMVHTPPRGSVVDRLPSGVHVGSPGVRALIEKYQPNIVVTGHIHEGAGEERIGRSHVLNPGAFAHGGYVRIDETPSGLVAALRSVS